MIDKRKHYVMVLDTETANTITETIPAEIGEDGEIIKPEQTRLDMSNVLMYDCGWAVVDTKGGLYETASYVNKDIFERQDLMQSAYYAKKIPRYEADLKAGLRKLANTYEIRQAMLSALDKYNIHEVAAHNAKFDHNALNTIQRYTTCSKYRYWFPFDRVEIWDTMRMAQDVICKMPTYIKFCKENGFLSDKGLPRKTAEILYRYISKNVDFVESHTGLEDVLIETQIMWYCFRQHKPMRKELFEKKEYPEVTDFQRKILTSIKKVPTINLGKV